MKMAGDSIHAAHMVKAREWILAQGGAARANVFTRIMLAMFEQIPWRGVPFIPVEIMLLPKWFPFHLDKVSYWSRTVMVPLFILCTYKVKARNPHKIGIAELFVTPPDKERNYFSHVKTPLGKAILVLERMGRLMEPLIPGFVRRKATAKARDWFMERLNGYDGLGAIFTAMVNAYEAMDYLGIPADNEQRRIARAAIDRLLVINDDMAYCQPCVSPIWDTGLAALALQEVDRHERDPHTRQALKSALRWLAGKQLRDEPGDWQIQRPNLPGGGWAFQFGNSYYPDVDDTAVVALCTDSGKPGSLPRISSGQASGLPACNPVMAAMALLTPTIPITISTTFHLPTTAPCSIRQPPMSAAAASCCWASWLINTRNTGRSSTTASITCARSRKRMVAGSVAGAPITFMALGRC